MVNYREQRIDTVFRALGDPTRRAMVAQLARGSATVGELGSPHGISKPAITKHVKVLERAGLIQRSVRGRVHHCRLEPQRLAAAEDWLRKHREFWEASLDSLARYVEEPHNRKKEK